MKDKDFFKNEYEVYPDWQYYEILKKLGLNGPCRILDVGCGSGAFSKRLKLLGFDVVGIDVADSVNYLKEIEPNKSVKM